ncbi:DUF3093 domain-containing protein [Actinoalloteichus sp. AHMU CJ021]|uniref:DUF3093 family protein n=1 Tax=Actinoalloteichus caeruleus DSM 43889 TaxID=1120930 RepID=A0ABT1JNB3_ACTCY|nr:DUF3093 family protein [Actinoalloteichus caeruleus]AUS78958.1 DUF3093 domain-containing protein [Actinoalloteichus sp. AHMU CJ021]MCP2333176.1 Protein of unknown function (DUF3093) [Actinoalloteichus caeruleus DSM 43889]
MGSRDEASQGGVLHRERLPTPTWVRIVGLLVGVGTVVLVICLHLFVEENVAGLVVGVVTGAVSGLFILLSSGDIEVRERQLVLVARPIVRKRLPTAEITAVEDAGPQRAADFGGSGWRVSGRRKRTLVMRGGEGVRITMSDGWEYLVVCSRPVELKRALERARR